MRQTIFRTTSELFAHGMLRISLGGCTDDMEVEVKLGIPLVAKTLNAWSSDWALIVPYERQRPESVVEVELA